MLLAGRRGPRGPAQPRRAAVSATWQPRSYLSTRTAGRGRNLQEETRDQIRLKVMSWIRIRSRIQVRSWIRSRIKLQMTCQNKWNMSLFEHFFKVLSLYLEARIRIRIIFKGRIQIRIKVTIRIRIRIRNRIRIKVMRIGNTVAVYTA
jgi:hypothetical protein